jgi:broad specificity phosphatase PhoE
MLSARSLLPQVCFVALGAFAQACAAPPPAARVAPVAAVTTVVVVRHAEKSADDPRDPSLTAAGEERARGLAAVLADAGVSAIYTTQYKRNRQTAAPIAEKLGIPVTQRPVDATNSVSYASDLAREILSRNSGKTVLVVGHSNTVPDIVKALSGRSIPSISDPEYDHIFIVEIPASGAPRLLQLRFGQPTFATP